MLKSKVLSIILIFIFCMSFMLAGFVVAQTAEAAAIYRALTAPTFSSGNNPSANLSVIEVDIPIGMEASIGDIITFSFPAEVTAPIVELGAAAKGIAVTDNIIPNADFIQVYVPALHPQTGQANGFNSALAPDSPTADQIAAMDADHNGIITAAEANAQVAGLVDFGTLAYTKSAKIAATGQAVDVQITNAPTADPGVFYVSLSGMVLNGASGDINISIAGSSGAFPPGLITVAKVFQPGDIRIAIKSVKQIGGSSGNIDTIVLFEETSGLFSPGTIIDFVLPDGIEWDEEAINNNSISVVGSWGLAGTGNAGAITNLPDAINYNEWYTVSRPNATTLRITFSNSYIQTYDEQGRINIGHEINSAYAKIKYLDQVRPFNVTILANSPNNEYLKEQYLAVARFIEEDLSNTDLSDLQVSGLTVSGFNPNVLKYCVDVPFTTLDIPEITASPANPKALITIYQARNLDGTEPERTATVMVQSQDQTVTETYKVVFTRSNTNQPPETSDCFIATAAFGSYLDPHVFVLRQFRDNVLVHSQAGRWFIANYYHYSPPLANYISDHATVRIISRILLTPVVFAVQYPSCMPAALILILGAGVLLTIRKRID